MHPASRPPASRRRSRARLGVSLLVTASVVGLPIGVAGGQDADQACEQPYAPVAFARTYPEQERLPTVDATDLARPIPRPGPFDSDGDGVDDVITAEPEQVTITRGDGDVVITAPGATATQAYGVGDVDGDGRDELAASAMGSGDANTDTVLVAGTIAPGVTPLADAGVRFGETGVGLVLARGDQLLVFLSGRGGPGPDRTDFHSASAVLARGAGNDLGGLRPSPSTTGTAVALADLGGPRDAVVVVDISPSDQVGLTVVDRQADGGLDLTYLTTFPEPLVPNYVGPGAVGVLDGPDGRFIQLGNTERGGSAAYLWSLDDPCTSLEPTEATPDPTAGRPSGPPAGAARPLTAAATFTG